jgi:monofunctional glycosyltransferase
MAGVKDKPNGEDEAGVADQADRADSAHGEGEGAGARRPAEPISQETLPDEAVEGSSDAPDELALQATEIDQSALTLPAPGLPDEPTFVGEPVISAVEAPDGEPAVTTALAWQPEVEPDTEPQSAPEVLAVDDASTNQAVQVDAATETGAAMPAAEPTEHNTSYERPPDELPAPAELLEEAEWRVAEHSPQEEPLAEPVGPEPRSLEEEPATAIAEVRGEAPWPEHAPIEPPTSNEPAALEPVQGAPLAEHTEAESTSAPEEPAAHAETLPIEAAPFEPPWPEYTPVELPTPDKAIATEPVQSHTEPPLRDRIPSVLPVELEAIKAPLEVPLFEAPPRPPEATQPTFPASSHASDAAFAVAASGVAAATAIPRPAEPIDERAPSRPLRDLTPLLHRAVRLALLTLGALACLVLVLIVVYRWVNPPASTLMLGQWLTGTRIDQRWVPLNRISPYLQRAVITSEDGQFCRHRGVDWGELEEAIERARDGIPRGGSTISMQVVKNLFLWPSKSYVRKALEFPLTFAIELAWSKPRILEIYLNIAEWGPGVFGAEAAARYHFGKSAATLTPSQAALLAVSLPNPIERRAGAPGPGMQRLAGTIHARMMASLGNAGCVQARR